MEGLRYREIVGRADKVLDFTSLTEAEFQTLVTPFEQAFIAHMSAWRLDGKRREKRAYSTYQNCPLPSPEDRLLFILSYLKSNALQVFHGQLFGLPQNKANQWIHTLLPVLRATFECLGDAPSRNLDELARRLGVSREQVAPELEAANLQAAPADSPATPPPLFAMTAPNDPSLAPKMRQNRKAAIAARKDATR
ncbi:MAG: transposase family protein [Blastochloris sp.]|nr:transposase family protein [Blastochloris sp.]